VAFLVFILVIAVLAYLIIPFVLLVRTRTLHDQLNGLERALYALDNRLARLTSLPAGAPAATAPPPDVSETEAVAVRPDIVRDTPATPTPEPAPAPEPSPVAAPAPPVAAEPAAPPAPEPSSQSPEPVEPLSAAEEEATSATPSPAGADDTTPPPQQPPSPPPSSGGPDLSDLEKRFGTQWVVWVGGIAIAFGGFFLVRYSIEQGWFGPGMRVFLGALLAIALIIAGEWARRDEKLSGVGGIPSANIPSILTAAGTAVAYADVWAAYGLYEFIGPGVAFALLAG
jgi:uncharacterized membrane protein